MRQRLVLAAVLAATAVPLPASAQGWLRDRSFSEGPGIRAGDLELHPGVGAEFGYDSNYFQRAEHEGIVDVYRLRITPSITLSTLGLQRRQANPGTPPSLAFRATAYVAYNQLFPVDSSREVPEKSTFDIGANMALQIAPQRVFSGDLYADYVRVVEPTNGQESDATGDATGDANFDRDTVRVGPGVIWRPGGGLFEWRVGYEALFNWFESDEFKHLNNFQHSVLTRGRWRFFPKTALVYDGAYRFIRYTGAGSHTAPNDGDQVSARVGLNGLLTPRISLMGMVGWMSTFYENVDRNGDTIIGQAEAKYFILPQANLDQTSAATGLSTVAVGYVRQISNSYLSPYYRSDRGYAALNFFLAGAFAASLQGGFSHLTFPRGPEVRSFKQNRIDASLFGEYRLSNTFGVNGTVSYDQNMSDNLRVNPNNPNAAINPAELDDLDFKRWRAFIGVRWFM